MTLLNAHFVYGDCYLRKYYTTLGVAPIQRC